MTLTSSAPTLEFRAQSHQKAFSCFYFNLVSLSLTPTGCFIRNPLWSRLVRYARKGNRRLSHSRSLFLSRLPFYSLWQLLTITHSRAERTPTKILLFALCHVCVSERGDVSRVARAGA